MRNSFRLFLCGLFLSLHAVAAENTFQSDLLETLKIYTRQNDLGMNKPSDNFMGFSITSSGSDNQITIYHADSPVDVIVNGYVCSASGCNQVARDPRCFYYTPGGSYSPMALYDVAFQQVQNPRDWSVDQIKFWQLGPAVYGRLSNLTTQNSELYSCSLKQSGLVCESVGETPEEP